MKKKGFTLIETLIVVSMIGILAAIMIPQFKYSVIRAKEAALKENLYHMRKAINEYFADKKKYPTTLDELVTYRYLRAIPADPTTKRVEWELVHPQPVEGEEYDAEMSQAVIDVKSLSPGTGLDGTKYQDW